MTSKKDCLKTGNLQEDSSKRDRLIDSRSILTNKARLKKFWEKRMEVEFELRQQRQQVVKGGPAAAALGLVQIQQEKKSPRRDITTVTTTAVASTGGDNNEIVLAKAARKQIKKLPLSSKDFDENNNGHNKAEKVSNAEDCEDNGQSVENILDNGQQGDMQQVLETDQSDGEWRSLTPNAEPVALNLEQDGGLTSNIQADIEISNRTQKRQQHVSAELLCEKLKIYQSNGEPAPSKSFEADLSREVPSIHNDDETVNKSGIDSDGGAQLLSIDPTLCRSLKTLSRNPLGGIENKTDENRIGPNVYDEHEEQSVNEEFSSSNSSFGPMSISIPRGSIDEREEDKHSKIAPPFDEDEQNSTQSGSVLTVIANLDVPRGKKDTQAANDPHQDSTSTEIDQISNLDIEQSNDQNMTDDRLGQQIEGSDDDNNIGVAFESLQFDNEIKSSRQEQVDEERLIAPSSPSITMKKANQACKFNSKEVKSVCNFITNAISDTTRQVEHLMKSKDKSSSIEANGNNNDGERQNSDQIVDSNGSSKSNDVGFLRATFVQESVFPTSAQDDNCDSSSTTSFNHNYIAQSQSDHRSLKSMDDDVEDEGEFLDGLAIRNSDAVNVPEADLSRIFEANVRREIERFESNSMLKKTSNNGKLTSNNSLTGWRIAEEIRLFNEREKELKSRFKARQNHDGQSTPPGGDHRSRQGSSDREQLESVVRRGKTFQIPRSISSQPQQSVQDNCASRKSILSQLGKSIKLTTTSNGLGNQQQATTMISMHKFISSGGKRIVYTQSPTSSNANSLAHQNHLTKSMSNLSATSPSTVDFKAVDSLNCREKPNVMPGLAKKAIETFSRLNDSVDLTLKHQSQQQQQHLQHSSSIPTAEWKIQEELREMRAREAELKTLRRQRAPSDFNRDSSSASSGSINASTVDMYSSELELSNQDGRNDDDQNMKEEDRVRTVDRFGAQWNGHSTPNESDKLSFSSDSLYPIKQTIDSFRRLNTSQANHSQIAIPKICRKQFQKRSDDQISACFARRPI